MPQQVQIPVPLAPARPNASAAPVGANTADQLFNTPGAGGGWMPPMAGGGVPAPPVGALPSGGGGVDSSSLDSGLGTDDITSLLSSMYGGITNEDIIKALTPTAGKAPLQMPPYFTRQLPEPGPLIQDQRQVVGAGNARAQGIGNSINAAIHGLAQFKHERDTQKQEAEATKVQRFIQAQNEFDKANQLLQVDPGNAAAQQAKDENDRLIKGMLADQKFSKTLEKGFNISLTDPSQNKTSEHGIVQRGIDLFRKKTQQPPPTPEQIQKMQDRFQQQARPATVGPNAFAMQQLQLREALAKDQMGVMKSILPTLLSQAGQNRRDIYNQRRMDYRANLAQGGANAREWARILNSRDLQTQRGMQAWDLNLQRAQLAINNAETILAKRLGNPMVLSAARNKFNDDMSKTIQNQELLILQLTQDRDKYQGELKKWYGGYPKAEKYPSLMDKDQKIYQAEQDLKHLKEARDAGVLQYKEAIEGKASYGPTGGSASTGSGVPGVDLGGTNTPDVSTSLRDAGSADEIYRTLYGGSEQDVMGSPEPEPTLEPNPQ